MLGRDDEKRPGRGFEVLAPIILALPMVGPASAPVATLEPAFEAENGAAPDDRFSYCAVGTPFAQPPQGLQREQFGHASN